MAWVLLVLLYGSLKGAREIFKKKAMVKSTVIEVLVMYTAISFVIVAATTAGEIVFGDIGVRAYLFGLTAAQYAAIAVKSFVIFVAWICGFRALRKMPVSVYGILDMARVVFSALLGILILGERPSLFQTAGIVLVCLGLFLLRFVKEDAPDASASANRAGDTARAGSEAGDEGKEGKELAVSAVGGDCDKDVTAASAAGMKGASEAASAAVAEKGAIGSAAGAVDVKAAAAASAAVEGTGRHKPGFYVFLAMVSCFLNAVSGNMDKILMKNDRMQSGQLQLWYMFFLVAFYVLYVLVRRIRLNVRGMLKNPWIWGLSILFVIADRALFIANGYADSRVIVMTVLKQSCTIITILGGWFVFREKKIGRKLLCAAVVITGIVLSVC